MAYSTYKPRAQAKGRELYLVAVGRRVKARTKKLATARKRAAGLLRRGSKRVSIMRGGKVFSLAAARKRRRSSAGRRTSRAAARRMSRRRFSKRPRRMSRRRFSKRRSSKRRSSKR
jgi:hypothetical protein